MRRYIIIIFAVIIFIGLNGCTGGRLNSNWNHAAITIDGDDTDWRGKQIVPKGQKVALGIMNDDSHLYLSFRTADQRLIMQLLFQGLSVWVDPKGGKRKTFGVRFPVGGPMHGAGSILQDRTSSYIDREEMIRLALRQQTGAEIYAPEDFLQQRISLLNNNDLKVRSGYDRGQFVYELRLPLEEIEELTGHEFTTGDPVGLGWEAVPRNRENLRDEMDQRLERGSMDGGPMDRAMVGGRGGKGGKRGGSAERQRPESLEVWLKVDLAESPQ